MRKAFLFFCILLLTLCGALALADTEYFFDGVSASLSLGDSYIVLTPDNLASHQELLSRLNRSKEVAEADFAERGVLLQAWVPELDACLEITAVKDQAAETYYDLDQQSRSVRNEYRASVLKSQALKDQGYSVKSADWKRQTLGGLFLMIKYKRTTPEKIYWGYARQAVRNGYTLTLDYQVFDRGLRAKDLNAVNKVANTVIFTPIEGVSATVSGVLTFNSAPPAETNTGTFTVDGKCTPGAHLIAVLMRPVSSTPTLVETTAKKNGTFKLDVTLPEEGVWVMTVTVDVAGQEIAWESFDPTTFNRTMLPVSLDQPVPEQLIGNEQTISGVTSKSVAVQCIVMRGGNTIFDKQVRTNGTGKFKFKFDTSDEADYDITLVFTKKNYITRRLTYTSRRELTEEDLRNQIRSDAIKPAYSTLTKKLDGYIGRRMVYTVTIVAVQQSGDEWIVTGAMKQTKKGYDQLIVITTDTEPVYAPGDRVKMYGTCAGTYQVQSEEDILSYPSFDLLFWDVP